jgi:dolichol-phosphate mannosyltransferase
MPELTPRVLVMIPTFNERGNIEPLIDAVFALGVPSLEILVVDDESPDGTADLVAQSARTRPGLRLLRRPPPAGRGRAGRDGFLYALEHKADFLIEMDGDFSHQPRHIPALLSAMTSCDIAIGSRLTSGGSDARRPMLRRWLTVAANAYARRLLKLPVHDTNSGFRCFSRKALLAVEPSTLRSCGPSILHESLYRAVRAGLRLREVPIDFTERKEGDSKLGPALLAEGWLAILRLRLSGR